MLARDSEHSGWHVQHSFYAFDLPVPGTTNMRAHSTQANEIFATTIEPLWPWKTHFSFSYSTRSCDWYEWCRSSET